MDYQKYIISIAADGIVPKEEPKALDKLVERFGNIQQAFGSPWYLNQDGIDEKIYFARSSKPLEQQEIDKLEAAFKKEHRTLKIFRLEDIMKN